MWHPAPARPAPLAKELLPDDLWALVEPILPPDAPRRERNAGRKRLCNRVCLRGVLFVLKTGIPWEDLRSEMGCGCGMTCWRRLRDWKAAGVWDGMRAVVFDRLRAAGNLDFSRAVADSASLRAVGAGENERAKSDRPRQARKQAPPRR
jgi:transposase